MMSKKSRDKTPEHKSEVRPISSPDLWGKIAPFLITAFIFIIYWNSLQGAFILDDHVSIRQNMSIRKLFPISIPLSPPENTSVSGRPLLNFSFALNYAISGLSVWSYHLFNIVIHVFASLSLYGVIRRTLSTPRLKKTFQEKGESLALICALIWAVHPIQTESVTYIIQRSESLAGFYYLGALYCFIRGADSDKARIWHGAAIVSCALGMGTKEMVATAPLVILFYDYFFLKGSFEKALLQRPFLYIGLTCSWAILAIIALGARTGSAGFGITGYGPLAYAFTQFGVIVHYIRLCFFPHPLVIDYLWFIERNPVSIILPGILIGVLLFLTGLSVFRKSPLGFTGVWFFLILAPTSSFFPIPTEIAAERRMYLPLAAVVTLTVLLLHPGIEKLSALRPFLKPFKKIISAILVIIVLMIFGTLTIRRNRDYHDPETLWKLVIKERPRNCRAFFNLGLFYLEHSRRDNAIIQLDKALAFQHESVDIAEIHYYLANLLYEKGRYDDAFRHYDDAMNMTPGNVNIMVDYGIALARRNQLEQAENIFRKALLIQPDNGIIHYNLANALEMQGKIKEAIDAYEECIRLDPDYPDAYRNLGDLLWKQGKPDSALLQYEKALQLKPDWQEVQDAAARIRNQIKK
ncbi:tetratricopeptide repeat protein [Candidatus Sumerlaeota bacterium]|nr:tetratricopeptide repeat protein [Candidatus Sumerlaeota bacterium]